MPLDFRALPSQVQEPATLGLKCRMGIGGGTPGRSNFPKNDIWPIGFKLPWAPETHYPKHLLRQNFPSKRKLGEFSLKGKIFPLRDNFPLKIAFPFPPNGQFSHEMKGLRKRSFYGLRESLWLSPARENLPQAIFLPQKMLWVINLVRRRLVN